MSGRDPEDGAGNGGIRVDRDFVVSTLSDVVAIESVNPSLAPGGAGEQRIAAHLGRILSRLGTDVVYREPQPGRISVVGTVRGESGGRSLMLNGHIDTVGVEGMSDPFRAVIERRALHGRGSYDMKGGVVASLAAVKALCDAGRRLAGDLVVAAVADEEHASLGTYDLVEHVRTDGAIVTEPTELTVCIAHKGFVWIEIDVTGRAAHGSRYDLGVDANLSAAPLLEELRALSEELLAREPHPLLGPPSMHVATIDGGSGWSTYADRCRIRVERRILPGETEEGVLAEVRRVIDDVRAAAPNSAATVRVDLSRPPFETAEDAPVVESLVRASRGVLGEAPPVCGQGPWMDAAILQGAGIETVVMGPRGSGAHELVEWVDLDSIVALAEILARAALDFCGEAGS